MILIGRVPEQLSPAGPEAPDKLARSLGLISQRSIAASQAVQQRIACEKSSAHFIGNSPRERSKVSRGKSTSPAADHQNRENSMGVADTSLLFPNWCADHRRRGGARTRGGDPKQVSNSGFSSDAAMALEHVCDWLTPSSDGRAPSKLSEEFGVRNRRAQFPTATVFGTPMCTLSAAPRQELNPSLTLSMGAYTSPVPTRMSEPCLKPDQEGR